MKTLTAFIFSLALVGLTTPAFAVSGGTDKFLWQIHQESDFSLLYIAGVNKGYEASGETKDDATDNMRTVEGGDDDAGSEDED